MNWGRDVVRTDDLPHWLALANTEQAFTVQDILTEGKRESRRPTGLTFLALQVDCIRIYSDTECCYEQEWVASTSVYHLQLYYIKYMGYQP
jgi:hypothetical protein